MEIVSPVRDESWLFGWINKWTLCVSVFIDRSYDHNNFNEEEIDALIEYLCTN